MGILKSVPAEALITRGLICAAPLLGSKMASISPAAQDLTIMPKFCGLLIPSSAIIR